MYSEDQAAMVVLKKTLINKSHLTMNTVVDNSIHTFGYW